METIRQFMGKTYSVPLIAVAIVITVISPAIAILTGIAIVLISSLRDE